jgi:DNA-binding response OmpR family regulator
MATVEQRLRALERGLRREEARLRRARARVAALRRAKGGWGVRRSWATPVPAAGLPQERNSSDAGSGVWGPWARGRAPGGLPGGAAPSFQVRHLALDRETNVVTLAAGRGQQHAALTPSEARLLALLMDRPGHVWSCRDLARLALGYDVVEAEAVEIVRPHISRLRRKLEPDPLQPRLIRTVRGQGYLLSL